MPKDISHVINDTESLIAEMESLNIDELNESLETAMQLLDQLILAQETLDLSL